MKDGTGRPPARINALRARAPAAARTATSVLAASPTAAVASTNVTAPVPNQVGSGQPIVATSAPASPATAAWPKTASGSSTQHDNLAGSPSLLRITAVPSAAAAARAAADPVPPVPRTGPA